MTTDSQTNLLWLAGCLATKQETFFYRFKKVLNTLNIPFGLLPHTKDIWAVDYMPIQIGKDKFVQLVYDPDYLQTPVLHETISDVDAICKAINLHPKKVDLLVDGGNIIRASDKILMTEKVFKENNHLSKKEVTRQLIEAFEVDKIFFIPIENDDEIGHIDGIVRFIDDNTVLINDYSFDNSDFPKALKTALQKAGLEWIELPYNPVYDTDSDSARGFYINYLQMSQGIIMPTFKLTTDDMAYKKLQEVFKGQTIATVDSREVAKEGGVLNCITWNILR